MFLKRKIGKVCVGFYSLVLLTGMLNGLSVSAAVTINTAPINVVKDFNGTITDVDLKGNTSLISVVNNPVTNQSGDKGYSLNGNSTADNTGVCFRLPYPPGNMPIGYQNIVELDVYRSGNDQLNSFNLGDGGTGGASQTSWTNFQILSIGTDGILRYRADPSSTNVANWPAVSATPLAVGQIHTIRLILHMDAVSPAHITANVYLDGQEGPGTMDITALGATVLTDLNNIRCLYAYNKGNGSGQYLYLDNFKAYTPPQVKSVVAVNAQEEYTDLNAIPVTTDALTIKFTKPMDAATLTGTSIRLMAGDTVVSCIGVSSSDGTQYTMRIGEVLKPMKQYQLIFSDSIKDTGSLMLSSPKTWNITTVPNVISSLELTVNGTPVQSIGQLSPQDVLTVSTTAVNRNAQPVNAVLIIALFKNDRLYDVAESRAVIPGNTTSFLMQTNLILPADAPASYTVQMFGWQDLVDIKPYTDALFIGSN